MLFPLEWHEEWIGNFLEIRVLLPFGQIKTRVPKYHITSLTSEWIREDIFEHACLGDDDAR